MMFAAFVWHWWISVFLVAIAVLAVVAVLIGYVMQVERPQYPTRRQGRQRVAQR